MKAVISLCDYTGNMMKPWAEAGYNVLLVDPQHEYTGWVNEHVYTVNRSILEAMPIIAAWIKQHKIVLVAGFPPCTDVAVSGSRWFEAKREVDPHFQAKAALVAEQCRMVGEMSQAPWFFENPVSVFSSIFGKPDTSFHPWQYTGYSPEDNYTKKTCLWTGGGFELPKPNVAQGLGKPDNRIHHAPPGPDRANFRSATPMGFAKAVFHALDATSTV